MKNKCLICGERIPECKCIKMNIEEQKAIEMLEYIKNKNTLMGFSLAETETTPNYRGKLAIIILNLIEKQQAEIENLKEEEMLDKADIEEIFRLRKVNEKAEKVIDLMAEYIVPLDIDEDICKDIEHCTDENNNTYKLCKECIKEYFYKEVKEMEE